MKRRWQDWIILVFGFWLLFSPWWLQYFLDRPYTDQTAASWDSVFLGITVVFVATWALAAPQKWEEWTNLILGLWLVASPWVLGFHTYEPATVNIVSVGSVITIMAAIGLSKWYQLGSGGHSNPPLPHH